MLGKDERTVTLRSLSSLLVMIEDLSRSTNSRESITARQNVARSAHWLTLIAMPITAMASWSAEVSFNVACSVTVDAIEGGDIDSPAKKELSSSILACSNRALSLTVLAQA
ncbi:MAG: hypothetical protein ACL7AX_06135 [Candidatus Arsenophonus phytopathogenicus]